MRKKFKYFLLLLLLIPFVNVSANDLASTEPKSGYRCYLVCKKPSCSDKIVLYTNRDMSNTKTIIYNVDPEKGRTEEIQDDNFGINLFAKTIQYPDKEVGDYHSISEYYNKGINGNLGGPVQEALTYVQNGIKAKKGDKYDDTISKFSSYDENSDISPYACIIAGETIDVADSNGGSLHTENFQFFYEKNSNTEKSQGTKVFNLSYYDEWNRPNIDDWLLLEGAGFYELATVWTEDMDPHGGWVNFSNDDILDIPSLDSSDVQDLMNNKNYFSGNSGKEKSAKINDLIDKINVEFIAHGDITHDKLIELMNCIPVNHDLNDVESQCKTEFEAAGKKTSGKEWKQCLKEKGYVWNGVCDPGFTFDVLPQLENAEITQQDSVDSIVASGLYQYEKAAFEFMNSGSSISCYDIRYATYVWRAICILAPFLFIIFGSLDFIKAIMAADEKAQKEARKKLPKRAVAFILLLILPVILRLIFRLGQYNSGNLGLLKCVVTFNTTSKDPVNTSKSVNGLGDSSDSSKPKVKYVTVKNNCFDFKSKEDCEAGQTSTHTCKWTEKQLTYNSTYGSCEEAEKIKLNCTQYGVNNGKSCPKYDDYEKPCQEVPPKNGSSKPGCDYLQDSTSEKLKKCTDYGMACQKVDDYGKPCEMVISSGSSTPRCDYVLNPKSCSDFGSSSECKEDAWGNKCEWNYEAGFGTCNKSNDN